MEMTQLFPATVEVATTDAQGRTAVDVTWTDRTPPTLRYYSYWLRLYSDPRDLYGGVSQQWTDGANFANDLPETAGDIVRADISVDGRLVVTWSDGLQRSFPLTQLRSAAAPDAACEIDRLLWDGDSEFASWAYEQLMTDDDHLVAFVRSFLATGLAFIHDARRHPRAVVDMANRLGTLEPSHLGETFTVYFQPSPGHIGETTDAIPLHIDLVYKQTPPQFRCSMPSNRRKPAVRTSLLMRSGSWQNWITSTVPCHPLHCGSLRKAKQSTSVVGIRSSSMLPTANWRECTTTSTRWCSHSMHQSRRMPPTAASSTRLGAPNFKRG